MRAAAKIAALLLLSLAFACQTVVKEAPSTTDSDGGTIDEPDPSEPAEPTAPPTDPAEAEACRLQTSWDGPVSTTCAAATAVCVDKAKTGSAVSSCISSDSACSTCFSEVVTGCLVGTPNKPGVCAEKAGCLDGCVRAACGTKPTDSCTRKAMAGACKTVSDQLQSCLDQADQTPCLKRFEQECLPKASCGNGTVETGETCDGACPTSCPSPAAGDNCTIHTLKGNPATCSAYCEQQSVCPTSCPANPTSISTLGMIASGSTLPATPKASWPTLASLKAHGCPSLLLSDSRVTAWSAPSNGRYTFSAMCSVIWSNNLYGVSGEASHPLQCVRRIALARGKQCAANVEPFACALDVDQSYQQSQMPDTKLLAPLDLKEGDELLLAVDFGVPYIPEAKTDTSYNGHISFLEWSVSATKCSPQCSGKTCGPDGCGGSCGTCSNGKVCSASATCQDACVPQCSGKTCGSNGCGGSCGTCSASQTCSASGKCEASCVPQCSGKTCGSNGCGGSCGYCSASETCTAGQCKASGACDPVSNTGCSSPNQCITLANESTQCALMGGGTQGSSCTSSADCKGGHACFSGTCRKICDRSTEVGCSGGYQCADVAGWFEFGTCSKP